MDRVGRIIDWQEGTATVEVGLHQECVSGSCSDCHAGAEGTLSIRVPWRRPYILGQRVLVRENRGTFRSLQWLAFLATFSALLGAAQAVTPATRPVLQDDGTFAGSWELKLLLLLAMGLGAAAWYAVKVWARRQPQYKVEALDSGKSVKSWSGEGTKFGKRGTPLSSRNSARHPAEGPAQKLVRLEEIQRVDR